MQPMENAEFKVFTMLNENIGILTMTPGISISVVEAFARMDGFVLQSFGAGNVPQRDDIITILKNASKRGCIIMNITQCKAGTVNADYECGRQLNDCGVICGLDMVTSV